jgi:hypothetical protein
LAQGWRRWATGNQPWKDTLETISLQGFEQKYGLIGFWANETTIFFNDEVVSNGVDDSRTGFKGRRNPSKWQFGSKFSLKNVILTKSHRKEDLMVGCKIISRCIVFGSPVANSYAQSNNITSEQGTPNNDVNSALVASSSQ